MYKQLKEGSPYPHGRTRYEAVPAVLFRRGFVAEVCCTAEFFFDHGTDLSFFCENPVEKVELAGWPKYSSVGYGYDIPSHIRLSVDKRYSTLEDAQRLITQYCTAYARDKTERDFKVGEALKSMGVTTVQWEETGGRQVSFRMGLGVGLLEPRTIAKAEGV